MIAVLALVSLLAVVTWAGEREVRPAPKIEWRMPDDLRKLPCVPMQYLLSNRPLSKIHSYSKDLKVCR